jgi:hypothetical protein
VNLIIDAVGSVAARPAPSTWICFARDIITASTKQVGRRDASPTATSNGHHRPATATSRKPPPTPSTTPSTEPDLQKRPNQPRRANPMPTHTQTKTRRRFDTQSRPGNRHDAVGARWNTPGHRVAPASRRVVRYRLSGAIQRTTQRLPHHSTPPSEPRACSVTSLVTSRPVGARAAIKPDRPGGTDGCI